LLWCCTQCPFPCADTRLSVRGRPSFGQFLFHKPTQERVHGNFQTLLFSAPSFDICPAMRFCRSIHVLDTVVVSFTRYGVMNIAHSKITRDGGNDRYVRSFFVLAMFIHRNTVFLYASL
jgi:hypothetical protein